jgi:hypothetical protein
LYGEGDFQQTLDLCCAMGFDADNQAATVAGLLGVVYGFKGLPGNLYLPVEGWTSPFNDNYINITRHDLPDAQISDIIDQTVKITIDLIVMKGGSLSGAPGSEILTVNPAASFEAPLEFCIGPLPDMEKGRYVDYTFYTEANRTYNWTHINGALPEGLVFNSGKLTGIPEKAGNYRITLQLDNGRMEIVKEFDLLVRTPNFANTADTIYANVRMLNEKVLDSCWYTFGKSMYAKEVDVINDGNIRGTGSVFYSLAARAKIPKVDYYGYGWNELQQISMVAVYTGCLEEFGGWFTSLNVQYLDEAGHWVPVEGTRIYPPLPATTIVFYQPHFAQYIIRFNTVETKGIRIIGDAAIQGHWNKYTKEVTGFTSITELCVYH